jgi:hypothetical protein
MSVDIEMAKAEMAELAAAARAKATEKLTLSRLDWLAETIAKKLEASITNAELAAAFASRNPAVLDYVSSDYPDGVALWKSISKASRQYVEDQLSGDNRNLFIDQFDGDFDPAFELQQLGLDIVEDWEEGVFRCHKVNSSTVMWIELVRDGLKQDVLSNETLEHVGVIVGSLPELKERYSKKYQLIAGAYSIRQSFEERRMADTVLG